MGAEREEPEPEAVPHHLLTSRMTHARQQQHNRQPVRAENLIRGCDLQGCSPGRLAMMIIDHVPAVRLPPDHARVLMAAAVSA